MPHNDPRIGKLIEDRWQQYNTIRETETSPEAFIVRVSQLLNQWYLDDALLLFSATDDEPRDQWFLVQAGLEEVACSTDPRAALQDHQARWTQAKAEVARHA